MTASRPALTASPRLDALRAELADLDALLDAEPAYNTTAAYNRRHLTGQLDRATRRRLVIRTALRAYRTDAELEAAERLAAFQDLTDGGVYVGHDGRPVV